MGLKVGTITFADNSTLTTAPTGFSGNYNDLTNKPTLFSENYNDLTNLPNLSGIATNTADLVALNNNISTTHPSWIEFAKNLKLPNGDVISSLYDDTDVRTLLASSAGTNLTWNNTNNQFDVTAVGFSGNYNDLTNKPTLFSENYNDLTNKPTLFSENYNDLTNLPNLSAIATNTADLVALNTNISTTHPSYIEFAKDLKLPNGDIISSLYDDTDARSALYPINQVNTGLPLISSGINVFDTDLWFNSTDSHRRLQFVNNGDTIIHCPSGITPKIRLRHNGSDRFSTGETVNKSAVSLQIGPSPYNTSTLKLTMIGANNQSVSSAIVFADSGNAPYYTGMIIYYDSQFNKLKISADLNDDGNIDLEPAVTIQRDDRYVGILKSTPVYPLDVVGDIQTSTTIRTPRIDFGDGTNLTTAPSNYTDADARSAIYPFTTANSGLTTINGGINVFDTALWYNTTDDNNRFIFQPDNYTMMKVPDLGNRAMYFSVGTAIKWTVAYNLNTSANDLLVNGSITTSTGVTTPSLAFTDGTSITTAPVAPNLTNYLQNTINTWHTSQEGNKRFFFTSASSTFITGGTNQGIYLQANQGLSTRMSIPFSGYINVTTSGGYAGSKSGRPYWGYNNTYIATSSYNFPTSLRCNQSILTLTYFITNSDIRIKKDIQDLDDQECLNKLLALKPKKYKYIETHERGENYTYGVIAQDVEEILPEAVKTMPDYLPNIYYQYSITNNIVTLDNNEKYTPVLNHKLKILDAEMNIQYFNVVEIIDNLNFKISSDDEKIINGEHFIYGFEVDDFKKLSKDHFHAITISSVQELHRKIEQQQEQINQLLAILSRNNIT